MNKARKDQTMPPKKQLAVAAPPNPCLLTPIPHRVNRFTATAGMLTLVLNETQGETDLDSVNSKVSDITDPNAPKAVDHVATNTSISFQMLSQKTYVLTLAFVQITAPFSSEAQLKEPCGQTVDTIDVTNLFPGYVVEVA
jgi:hypothetical protein